jgi:RNA polymerase-binding transcription factor DksA
VRHTHTVLVKEALLKKLDQTLQHDFHQTLSEIIIELKIRNAIGQSKATPDSIFAAIRQSQILHCKSTSSIIQIRSALDRMNVGKFGQCVRCGRKIQALELERNPLVEICSSCDRSKLTNEVSVR